MKEILFNEGQKIKDRLAEISELGNQEFKAVEILTSFLEEHHFTVEREFLNIKTAFRATFDSKKEGPTIGYLCEYDA